MNKKSIYIIIGVGIIVIIGSWFIFSGGFWQFNIKEVNVEQEAIRKKVTLAINDGINEPINFEADVIQGMTAFDLLKNKAEEANLSLQTKTYDIGILVEAIGSTKNGEGGKYWLYYVNGEMPMVSADKMILKPGDKIEFKFEKSAF